MPNESSDPPAGPSGPLLGATLPSSKNGPRVLRNLAPQNLIRQHSTNLAPSHHKQYVILRDKQQQQSQLQPVSVPTSPMFESADSPSLKPQTSNNSLLQSSGKVRPYLKKQKSQKYLFSVDDNEDEIEQDLNREYLEGFTDGIRGRVKLPNNHTEDPKKRALEQEIAANLSTASKDLRVLRELENDSQSHSALLVDDYSIGDLNDSNNITATNIDNSNITNNNNNDEMFQNISTNEDNDVISTIGAGAVIGVADDNESLHSVDSFTLEERQVAINQTHPFGIRIWKPAIYKKDRSVQLEAENDIHCTPGPNKRSINISVKIANFFWSMTFGLFLFILCCITGLITLIFSLPFSPRSNDSIKYAKFYWSLGKYLFSPFGILVILKSDNKYIDEDANVGSSMDEFERWRSHSQGRLFFSSSLYPNSQSQQQQQQQHKQHPLQTNTQLPTSPDAESRSHSFQQYPHTSLPVHSDEDDDDSNVTFYKKRFFGRGQWNVGRVLFYIQFYLIIYPISVVMALCMWLSVFTIPMAKVLTLVYSHIRRHPLALSFEDEEHYYKVHIQNETNASKTDSFLILTYRSFGFHYYKYTVDGTNIFFINLIFLVIFTIFDFYILKESLEWKHFLTDSTTIFILCLISVIPLAYFIGQAVASISAQTSMGVGAVINAFFSTIVEIYLYCIALDQSKAKLVEGSIIGSILCGVLLLPGGSMCFGAIKRKTQRYNPASAGVSSTMLLFSILVMLSPSILYQIYGQYQVVCKPCSNNSPNCSKCHYYQPSITIDPLYVDYLRPFSIICAIGLFLCYCICLLFTLKTHAALIWSTTVTEKKKLDTQQVQQQQQQLDTNESISSFSKVRPNLQPIQSSINPLDISQGSSQMVSNAQNAPANVNAAANTSGGGGHDAPNWSRTKSTTILLLATILYAIIAEILVDCVDDVLSNFTIDPKLLGLTVFALVPNTTEFVNAFSFAMHGNVALSMEIGSAYALQVCLLQIPIVTLYSTWKFTNSYFSTESIQDTAGYVIKEIPRLTKGFGLFSSSNADSGSLVTALTSFVPTTASGVDVGKMFPLIFPHWDFMASLIGVYMFTYIYTEGKSNYFKGSILLTLYLVLLVGFYFALEIVNNRTIGLEAN